MKNIMINSVFDYIVDQPELGVVSGNRYLKITRNGKVDCYIDCTNGNIFKATKSGARSKKITGNTGRFQTHE